MKSISIISAHMENFKKFSDKNIEFGKTTAIYGKNTSGKSSVADVFPWVMFNKSSTGNAEGKQFRPRRYDEKGENIDHVDVVGEVVLLIDGEEVKVRKTQRQKWVRHKGDDYDSYMGDETLYEWNDIPVTPTEHKKKVEEIISEEVFRMLTNPAAFPTMEVKKQREFLLKNIANITDDDVFATSSEYDLIRAAMGNGTLDALEKKNKKEMDGYAKKQQEIPIRIDQESKSIKETDFSIKEALLDKLQRELADIESRLEDTEKAYGELNNLKCEKVKTEGEIALLKSKIVRVKEEKVMEIQKAIDTANYEFNRCFSEQAEKEKQLAKMQQLVEVNEKELAETRSRYMDEMKKELSEDAFICPTCGQEIPEEQRATIKAEFEQKKQAILTNLNKTGKDLAEDLKNNKATIEELEKGIENLKEQKLAASAESNKCMTELENLKLQEIDFESNPEYISLTEQLATLEKRIEAINTADADTIKAKLKSDRDDTLKAIYEVKETLALKTVYEKSKATIEALKAEMVEVTQSLANCEKLDMAIEKFKRAKMDMLLERINDKFKAVTWKLFEKQKNGRYADVCVCQINGSDYGENTTSATERMMAGMDIISTLQDIYEVKAPIFLDDADLYNDWNIPAMDCQLIKLLVSEDEELRIEVE